MEKVTLILSKKYDCEALQSLSKLGVLHIKNMREPSADYIDSLEHKLSSTNQALAVIGSLSAQGERVKIEDEAYIVKEILALDNKRKLLLNEVEILKKKLSWFEQWGEVSFSSLEYLKKAGVFLRLYHCDKKTFKHILQKKNIYILNKNKSEVYFVLVSTAEDERINLPEAEVPRENKAYLDKKIKDAYKDLARIEKDLTQLSLYQKDLIIYKGDLIKRLNFCKARFGMFHEEEICALQGFCPKESVKDIESLAAQEGWALKIEEPQNLQEVPTLIRNPKWIKIIKPVFDFMGTLPGYQEYDISFWFLFFFSLFFAMIIGDAAYGLIFLVATLFIHKKLPKVPKEPIFLMYVLSGATIIWGALSGTWFGFEKIAQLPVFNALIVDKINSFVDTNQVFIIYWCFLIGAIQLTLAHGIVAFRYINSLFALSQLGWIFIIWTAFFVAGNLVLNNPLPSFTLLLGISGAGLVILFANFQKNILKGIATSLADFPLSALSSFSDIVSYLRLFAVGYATLAVADTFNTMALSLGRSNFILGLTAAIILFLGHSLNIILGLMSVIVHGIRLNMLEFSGHLNMQWSGLEYKPFKD
jgi:V/A-type H+-transporting ATPase subunit I